MGMEFTGEVESASLPGPTRPQARNVPHRPPLNGFAAYVRGRTNWMFATTAWILRSELAVVGPNQAVPWGFRFWPSLTGIEATAFRVAPLELIVVSNASCSEGFVRSRGGV